MPVSVWEGGDSWLREVTGRHGSNFLPFSGPSVGYWISFLGSLGNGRFRPNPSREVTRANFCHLAAPQPPTEFLFWDHWETAFWGQILAGRSREVMGGYNMEENGGNWRNSEAQRRAASVGVRNKIVCKGMRSDTGRGEGLQSKQKSSKGAADGLGF